MKRILAKRTLREFWENHPDSEIYLKTWYQVVSKANWSSPNEVKQNYANASILKNQRVVFNIKGNDYRLVAKINYEAQILFVRFLGTHKEYDQIDAENI